MVAAQHKNVKNENSKHCTKAHSFLFKHDNNDNGGRVASEHRHSAWTRDPGPGDVRPLRAERWAGRGAVSRRLCSGQGAALDIYISTQ